MQANINIHSLELDCPDQHHVQELGQDLVCVLDQLKVKFVVGLGEGAGANILARWGKYFSLFDPQLLLKYSEHIYVGLFI